MEIPGIMLRNKVKLKYRKDFERIFQLDFNRFFHLVTRFNISLLDEVLKIPNGVSLQEYVTREFGKEGELLILKLL